MPAMAVLQRVGEWLALQEAHTGHFRFRCGARHACAPVVPPSARALRGSDRRARAAERQIGSVFTTLAQRSCTKAATRARTGA